MSAAEELVVLLDGDGRPSGTAAKHAVHTSHTPLHLAFSCHVVDDEGRLLLTRRALGKAAWPGVWTNACCGHPGPGESLKDAVRRRLGFELGAAAATLELVVPDFTYRATDASGIVEHEHCPVFVATLSSGLDPNPDEVMELAWAPAAALASAVRATPWAFSPWLVLQAERLPLLGGTA